MEALKYLDGLNGEQIQSIHSLANRIISSSQWQSIYNSILDTYLVANDNDHLKMYLRKAKWVSFKSSVDHILVEIDIKSFAQRTLLCICKGIEGIEDELKALPKHAYVYLYGLILKHYSTQKQPRKTFAGTNAFAVFNLLSTMCMYQFCEYILKHVYGGWFIVRHSLDSSIVAVPRFAESSLPNETMVKFSYGPLSDHSNKQEVNFEYTIKLSKLVFYHVNAYSGMYISLKEDGIVDTNKDSLKDVPVKVLSKLVGATCTIKEPLLLSDIQHSISKNMYHHDKNLIRYLQELRLCINVNTK